MMLHGTHGPYLMHLSRRRIGLLVALLALLLLLLALVTARGAAAAPLLDRGDEPTWARDAVGTLQARGLLESPPGGAYKGDRAMTRDEAAELLGALRALVDREQADLGSRAELGELERQVEALHDALEGEGTRTDALGPRVEELEQRVEGVDRPSL